MTTSNIEVSLLPSESALSKYAISTLPLFSRSVSFWHGILASGLPIFFPRILGTQCTYINQSEIGDYMT